MKLFFRPCIVTSEQKSKDVGGGEEVKVEEEHANEIDLQHSDVGANTRMNPPPTTTTASTSCSNRSGSKTPVLRKVGEKTPPGTLKKSKDRPSSSCKLWCEQYSQTFLSKTIDTPLPDPGPYTDEDEEN